MTCRPVPATITDACPECQRDDHLTFLPDDHPHSDVVHCTYCDLPWHETELVDVEPS